MKTTFISTFSLADSSRRNIMSQSNQVNRLSVELSSGRKFDVGLDLGTKTGESVALRSEFHFLHGIIDTNALTKSRLETAQAAMNDILTDAQDFMASLVALNEDPAYATVLDTDAIGKQGLLTSRLNTQLNGSYIFSGINSDQKPIADYSDPAAANKVSADAAFLAEFGFTQADPNVSTITPAAMSAYLAGNFDTMFQDPAWGTTWSSASDTPVTSRIAANETVTSSVSANEEAFRDLAQVYTMMSDLGNANLSQDTFKVVIDAATEKLGSAIGKLTSEMGKLGTVQQQVTLASERLTVQTNILNVRVNDLETVNLEETSVRLNTALTQLETTYAVTSKMQGMSLLNYI